MSTFRQFFFIIAMVAVLAVVSFGSASADPIRNPLSISFNLTCADQEFTVISANEPTATLHIIGDTDVLVATEATLTTTYTDPQSGQPISDVLHVIFGGGHGEATGLEDHLITCSHVDVFEDPSVGQITVSLIATFIEPPQN